MKNITSVVSISGAVCSCIDYVTLIKGALIFCVFKDLYVLIIE